MSGALSTFADLELASDDPPFESEPAWFSYEDECMPDDENDDLLDVDDEDECMPRALRTPQLRLPGIVSLAESCTPSVFTDAGMLDGEMLLPNAVAPEHAAAVSGPAHRPSETPIAISTPRAPIHAAARAVPSDQHASCGGAENFSPCPVAEEAPGHARPATVCDLIPLVRHTLIHSGTSLRHHYVSMQKTLFRTDPFRVFLSKRVITGGFTVNWARAICFLVGFTIFYSDPAANSSFEKARERNAFKARLLRFTTLQLRNGQRSSITHHGLAKFGVLHLTCKVAQPHNVSHHAASATLAFSKPVTFDGWWLETRHAEAALDPVMYVIEYSDNGTEWRVFASSHKGDVCGYRGAQQTKAYVTEYLLSQDSIREPTTQRGVTEAFTFESSACLLPTHLIQVAQILLALAYVTTPFIAIFLRETLTPPAQILGLAGIVVGILKIIAAVILAVKGRSHEIPSLNIKNTHVTLIIESLIGIFCFPGLLAFDERFIVEGLMVRGLVETVSRYASGLSTINGIVALLLSSIVVGIREHHFFKGRNAVNEDQRTFNEAWARIQEEEGAKEAQERLYELTHNFQLMHTRPGHARSHDVSLNHAHTCASVSVTSTTVMPSSRGMNFKGDEMEEGGVHDLETGCGARLEHGWERGAVFPLTPQRGGREGMGRVWQKASVGATVSSAATLSLDQLCAQSVVLLVNESLPVCVCVSVLCLWSCLCAYHTPNPKP
jgi:hypothetical protein